MIEAIKQFFKNIFRNAAATSLMFMLCIFLWMNLVKHGSVVVLVERGSCFLQHFPNFIFNYSETEKGYSSSND